MIEFISKLSTMTLILFSGGKKKKSGKENKLFSDSDDEPESSVEEVK